MGQINLPDNWIDEKRDLQRQIDELRAAVGLSSATISRGGLTIENDAFFKMLSSGGVQIVYIGPSAIPGHQGIVFRRSDGTLVMDTQYDVVSATDFWAFWDRSGHIVMSDDVQAGVGLARPWLSVPMNPMFSMAANILWSYMNLTVASVTTETVLWEGRIPLATHPKVQVNGVWGQASGSNNSTFKLYVDGSSVGTWTENGVLDAGVKGPFDISSVHDRTDLVVQVRASASGTGNVACHVHNLALRQS